ncbi:MAG: chemotaxis protein CheW [Planctomycetaceae bacterium]|nr:chemotaxis protein CheW [Planctomycetaceae bacterium]
MNDRQIVDEFVAESCDHLADIESQLLAIEANGAAIDEELVNTVFRAVHSIKGTAGFLQLSNIQDLSHEMETVLNLIRSRELAPDAGITNALLRAADTLRAMVENVDNSGDVDVSEHLTALRSIASGAQTAVPVPPPADTEKTLDMVQTFVAEAASEPANDVRTPADSVSATETADRGNSTRPTGHTPATETNIRVSVRVLDHLMNLAGELVLSRNQLLQTVGSKTNGNLDSISARLNQVTSEIQEAVMQTRLQVVETVFSKFPRVVRDLCGTLGKQCDLVVEGEDVELDKSIIEAIGDPLTHLIRNAVDHGLETPAERIAAGKSPKGRILLKAFHQAGKVHLVVRDDGAGIDVARIREKAVAKGIITAEQAHELGDRESLRLIFRPGFSTADQLTNISGRGVGMDVVRTNIERLGGTVDVDSRVGQGTGVNLTLPLTLAIVPSLIVRCGAGRFAIPQASISELVRVKAGERADKLQCVNDAEVLRLRGNLLPLVRLSGALRLPSSGANTPDHTGVAGNTNIIVVESGHLRYGLIVDALHDSEEIVVKPLGKNMKDCRCFAGATILGDGQVALILDVAGLAAQASLAIREEKDRSESVETMAASADSQAMLLFTNASTEQFAVPMGLISRLERIRGDQIDSVGGQEVLQYRGASLTLLSLEKQIRALPRAEQQRLYVIVFRVGQREIGLIAPQLTDIRAVPTEIDTTSFREPGVVGSLVLEGKTTRLLDLLELCRAAHPDWFEHAPQAETPAAPHAPTILLAEDSGFFRKQLVSFLQADGYNVLACEDGQIAWDALRRPGQPYDLIVTDLEMPHMNGFDLAKRVKSDPSLRRLPIIAVTSLASEEDVERGRKAGIDEYLIKLDRDQLVNTVAERLRLSRLGAVQPQNTTGRIS